MKSFLIVAFCIAMPAVALGWSESDVTTLKETNACRACDLNGADLRWANVYASELGGAPNLVGADLTGSDLTGANLYGANLESATLSDSKLNGADLRWSTLHGADLSGADIGNAKLDGTIFCKTIMPDGSVNDSDC